MKMRAFLAILALIAASLACSVPNVTVNVPVATEPPIVITGGGDGGIQPTANPLLPALPTNTVSPIIPFTPTSSAPTVRAGPNDVNCRYGPGMAYLAVGYLLKGYDAPILGISDDDGWWYIQDPRQSGIYCFVANNVTVASGDTSSVPTISTPPTRVINVTVQASVPSPTPCVGGWPVSIGFNATIETNGPGLVTWHWELSQGNVTPPLTLMFTSFGSQSVADNHHVGAAGDYWVLLRVTAPNEKYRQADYTVTCTP